MQIDEFLEFVCVHIQYCFFPLADDGCLSHGGCHGDANCVRQASGSYQCECNPGYHGNGVNCTSKIFIS